MNINEYNCAELVLPKITFGNGCINSLPGFMQDFNVKAVMIVTDRNLGKTEIVCNIKKLLYSYGFSTIIFDKVESDPEIGIAERCIQECRESGAVLIIGVGGGSTLDIGPNGT